MILTGRLTAKRTPALVGIQIESQKGMFDWRHITGVTVGEKMPAAQFDKVKAIVAVRRPAISPFYGHSIRHQGTRISLVPFIGKNCEAGMVRSSMESRCATTRLKRSSCWVAAPLAFLLCATALAQSAGDAQHRGDSEWFRHIRTTDPGRPNSPLRQDNITDEEVSEVQRAALDVYPDFIVNISGVTNGCDCEEGRNCTAQVWLALYREGQTRSLVLSKIDGHWKIGAVQRWWLQYSAHQSTHPGGFGGSPKHIAWQQENQRLLDSFPACPIAPVNWMLVRNGNNSSTYVDMSSVQETGSIRRVNFKHVLPLPERKFSWQHSTLFSISRMAFDCKEHRLRIDDRDYYYDDGTASGGPGRMPPLIWDPIQPKTDLAADWDLVCGWSGK